MQEDAFREVVRRICGKDPRYAPEVYFFVRETLDYTAKMLDKPQDGPGRHVSGQELLEGIRVYALQQYGPMALTLLHTWGIRRTEDFGEIVFNLVESGKLGKTEEDSRADFADGYDFETVFRAPFLPREEQSESTKRQTSSGPGRSKPRHPPGRK